MIFFFVVAVLDMPCSHYPAILDALFALLQREHEPRVVDNICAAVCRMIVTDIHKVPMDQVICTT